MIKKFLCAVVLCVCLGGGGVAQQNAEDAPASKEDVERYLQVMHSREMVTKIVDAMSKPLHDMIHQQYLKSQDNLPPDFEARMNKRMDEMLKSFPWNDLIDAMVPVYQKHFSKGDLDALVTFYGSTTGQKVLRELPAISAESMQHMMPMLQSSIENMQKGLQEDITAMIRENQLKSGTSNPQKNK